MYGTIQPLLTVKRGVCTVVIQTLGTVKRGVCTGLFNPLLQLRGVYVLGYSSPCYS